MIDKYARRTRADFALHQFAVDPDLIGRQYALSDMSRLTIDRHAPCDDQLFHITTGTQTGLSQYFVQLGRIVVCREIASSGLLQASPLPGSRLDFVSGGPIKVIRGYEAENRVGVCTRATLAVALICVLGLVTRTGLATLRFASGTMGADPVCGGKRLTCLFTLVRAS